MIYKASNFTRSEDVGSVLTNITNDNLLPKIVFFSDGTQQFIRTASEQTSYEESRDPETESSIVYPNTELGLVFGDDYPTLILNNFDESLIFADAIPAPTLSATLNVDNNAALSWGSSYQTSTKVYRTETYTGGQSPADYILIAEVDGYTTSQGTSTFVDTLTLDVSDSVDYFVQNTNGMSNIVTISRT